MEAYNFVVIVLPDLKPKCVVYSKEIGLNIKKLFETINDDKITKGNDLYLVTPSLMEKIDPDINIQFSDEFVTNFPQYRIQFYPKNYPQYILRFQPALKEKKAITIHKWNVGIEKESNVQLSDILNAFSKTFFVETDDLEFVFDKPPINIDAPILSQIENIKKQEIKLVFSVTDREFNHAKKRVDVLKEIEESEERYVNDLVRITENFTKEFFQSYHIDPDVYRRTFKSVAEILPLHATFLKSLKKIGSALETSIGPLFLEFIPFFKVAAPHVSNFSSVIEEITDILQINRPFEKAVFQICRTVFGGNTVESLLVTPVQRIPRYPLLLKELLKCMPDCHWDKDYIQLAHNNLTKLNQEIDQKTSEQKSANKMAQLQKKLGRSYNVLASGRSIISTLDIEESSLYLFNDLLLIQTKQDETYKFKEFPLITTKVLKGNSLSNFTFSTKKNVFKCPITDESRTFVDTFSETKRDFLLKKCTFDGSLRWTSKPFKGPPELRSAAIASILFDLYLFGGRRKDDNSVSNELWWFHEDTWELVEVTNAPRPRYDCSMNVYGTSLVVFGGHDNENQVFDDLLIFDIPTANWTVIDSKSDMKPTPRFAHASAFLGSQLWIYGGKSTGIYFNDLYCYDFQYNDWWKIETSKTPEPRAWATAFWIPEKIIKRRRSKSYIPNNQEEEEEDDNNNYECDANFAIFGGVYKSATYRTIWVFDYDHVDWVEVETQGDQPTARYSHVSAQFNNALYVIGGRNMQDSSLDPYRLDMTTQPFTWSVLPQSDEPNSFDNGMCCVVDDFGLALYSTTLYFIKLKPDFVSVHPIQPKDDDEIVKNKFEGTRLSSPIYNIESKTVSTFIDKPKSITFDFSSSFDEKSIDSIMKLVDGQGTKWKEEAVLKTIDNFQDKSFFIEEEEPKLPFENSDAVYSQQVASGRIRSSTLNPFSDKKKYKNSDNSSQLKKNKIPLDRASFNPNEHDKDSPLKKTIPQSSSAEFQHYNKDSSNAVEDEKRESKPLKKRSHTASSVKLQSIIEDSKNSSELKPVSKASSSLSPSFAMQIKNDTKQQISAAKSQENTEQLTMTGTNDSKAQTTNQNAQNSEVKNDEKQINNGKEITGRCTQTPGQNQQANTAAKKPPNNQATTTQPQINTTTTKPPINTSPATNTKPQVNPAVPSQPQNNATTKPPTNPASQQQTSTTNTANAKPPTNPASPSQTQANTTNTANVKPQTNPASQQRTSTTNTANAKPQTNPASQTQANTTTNVKPQTNPIPTRQASTTTTTNAATKPQTNANAQSQPKVNTATTKPQTNPAATPQANTTNTTATKPQANPAPTTVTNTQAAKPQTNASAVNKPPASVAQTLKPAASAAQQASRAPQQSTSQVKPPAAAASSNAKPANAASQPASQLTTAKPAANIQTAAKPAAAPPRAQTSQPSPAKPALAQSTQTNPAPPAKPAAAPTQANSPAKPATQPIAASPMKPQTSAAGQTSPAKPPASQTTAPTAKPAAPSNQTASPSPAKPQASTQSNPASPAKPAASQARPQTATSTTAATKPAVNAQAKPAQQQAQAKTQPSQAARPQTSIAQPKPQLVSAKPAASASHAKLQNMQAASAAKPAIKPQTSHPSITAAPKIQTDNATASKPANPAAPAKPQSSLAQTKPQNNQAATAGKAQPNAAAKPQNTAAQNNQAAGKTQPANAQKQTSAQTAAATQQANAKAAVKPQSSFAQTKPAQSNAAAAAKPQTSLAASKPQANQTAAANTNAAKPQASTTAAARPQGNAQANTAVKPQANTNNATTNRPTATNAQAAKPQTNTATVAKPQASANTAAKPQANTNNATTNRPTATNAQAAKPQASANTAAKPQTNTNTAARPQTSAQAAKPQTNTATAARSQTTTNTQAAKPQTNTNTAAKPQANQAAVKPQSSIAQTKPAANAAAKPQSSLVQTKPQAGTQGQPAAATKQPNTAAKPQPNQAAPKPANHAQIKTQGSFSGKPQPNTGRRQSTPVASKLQESIAPRAQNGTARQQNGQPTAAQPNAAAARPQAKNPPPSQPAAGTQPKAQAQQAAASKPGNTTAAPRQQPSQARPNAQAGPAGKAAAGSQERKPIFTSLPLNKNNSNKPPATSSNNAAAPSNAQAKRRVSTPATRPIQKVAATNQNQNSAAKPPGNLQQAKAKQ